MGSTAVIEHRQSDGSEIAVLYYEYDRVGNPLSIVREDGSATYYAYDGIYQLTGEVQLDGEGTPTFEAEYQYDAAHNRTVKVIDGEATYYAYNAAKQMVSSVDASGPTYYWYDGRGNLIHRQTPAGNMYFDYDGENHMVHQAWGTNSHSYFSLTVTNQFADGRNLPQGNRAPRSIGSSASSPSCCARETGSWPTTRGAFRRDSSASAREGPGRSNSCSSPPSRAVRTAPRFRPSRGRRAR